MSTLQERLALAMASKPGITAADLARACKVKAPSVSEWINGPTKSLRGDNLIEAAKLLEVNSEWLGTGKGQMRRKGQAKPVSQSDATRDQNPFPPEFWVPVQGAAVVDQNGYWESLEDLDSGRVLWNVAKPGAYAIEIKTDRYHPDLRRGVIAIFQPNSDLNFGEFALVKVKDGRCGILEFLRRDEGLYTFNSLAGGQRVTFDASELLSVDAWIGTVPASQKQVNGVG